MDLKQRLCGFAGHRSELLIATNSGRLSHAKLKCKRCDLGTKWFRAEHGTQVELSHVDIKLMKDSENG